MKNRDWMQAASDQLPKVHFDGKEFELSFHRYEHAPHLCMRLTDERGHYEGVWASAVFAADARLATNEVLVHDHVQDPDGGVGLLRALENAGVVRATGRHGNWLGLRLPVAELLVKPPRHLVEGAERARDRQAQNQQQQRDDGGRGGR